MLFLQSLLTEFKLIGRLSKLFAPLLRIFGLPESTHFLWIVANTLGLTFGAAVIIEGIESGSLTSGDAELLNRHVGLSHSLLEDTLLFAAIGVSALAITVPRIAFAVIVVWGTRGLRRLRAGTS